MKILMVASSFPRSPGDWAGVFLYQLAVELRRRGHTVAAIAPHAPGCATVEKRDGIEIFRFRYFFPESLETLAYGDGIINNIRKRPLRALLVAPFFLGLLFSLARRRRSFDIVHAHWAIPQGLACRVLGMRAVISLHGADASLKLGLNRFLLRFALGRSLAITANSAATGKCIKDILHEREVAIIPMGVDVDSFYPNERNERARKEGAMRLISVGRLIPFKGHRYLIEALFGIREKFPNARLTIVGGGPEREGLEKLVWSKNLNGAVEFLGERPAHQIPRLLNDHDIFILPSITMPSGETEGLGVALIEAMAAGIPVIGTRTGGIPDVITHGENGLLVSERSPDAITEAVCSLAADEKMTRRLAARAAQDVRDRFGWGKIAADFEALYRKSKRN